MAGEQDREGRAFAQPGSPIDRKDEAALARDYAQAAKGDAWHQRASDGGGDQDADDPTLVASQDESAPSTQADRREREAAEHGPGSGPVLDENGAVSQDALKRGLEPGEMGEERFS